MRKGKRPMYSLENDSLEIRFCICGTETMINQPVIIGGNPIGIITEVSDDFVTARIFGRYFGIEGDIETRSMRAIHLGN